MRRIILILFAGILSMSKVNPASAQCSICTKTASQLGEKAGNGLNTGIIYLMLTPFAVVGIIGFKFWKQGRK